MSAERILAFLGGWTLVSLLAGAAYAWYRRSHPKPWSVVWR